MKLSGNKRGGRYIPANVHNQAEQKNGDTGGIVNDAKAAKASLRAKRIRRTQRVLTVILLVAVAAAAGVYGFIKLSVKPPAMKPKTPISNPASPSAVASGSAAPSSPVTSSSDRKGNQYTFAIVGFDDGNGNSDTIMVANFDADKHKLNVVNIPRDTLVNVSWYTKKANTLYASGGGMDGVVKGMADIVGFEVDFYVKVDLTAFEKLVDAVGGVDFNVPVNMNYDDPAQDLSIHFNKGLQHLNGEQAMKVVRYRKGYADADIGRIATQQSFLATAAQQIIKKQNQLNLEQIASLFIKYVKTDLTAGNLVWLGKEFYKMNAEDITFTTLPAEYNDEVNDTSYCTIHVNDWLKVLNEKISPFKQAFAASDLSLLTRDKNGSLYVTNGAWAGKKSWGSGSDSGSSVAGTPKPSPSPSPKPSPSPSQSPSASPSGSASPNPSGSASPSPSGSPKPSPSTSPGGTASPSPGVTPSPSGTPKPSASPGATPSPGVSGGSTSEGTQKISPNAGNLPPEREAVPFYTGV